MRLRNCLLFYFLAACLCGNLRAQQSAAPSGAAPAKPPAKKSAGTPQPAADPNSSESPADAPDSSPGPEVELQLLVRQAGNDSATLVKNLEAYLVKYPDSPHRGAIYRGLLESEMNLHNQSAALEYALKAIALQPEDNQSMYVAVTLLEKKRDEASQNQAVDYDTRLIDRVSKADPESRPQQMTLEDWQAGRNKFLADLYGMRGRLEHHLHKNDDAAKDLNAGFRLLPNATAAMTLGEIAEEDRRADEAIRQYAIAFALAGQESSDDNDPAVDRDALRSRMGNLWRFTHDSSAGLGDIMLSAYDKGRSAAKADKPDAPVYNKGATDPLQFSLRRIDGSDTVKLGESREKVTVVNFWTTWCAYCVQMEAKLSGVRSKFAGRDDIVFLTVNADEDESPVAEYLQEQKPGGILVFADGINQAFHVESIPTVLVLDKAGKIAYRMQGFAPDGFADLAAAAITKASASPSP